MKSRLSALAASVAALAAATPVAVHAEDAPSMFAFNVGAVTDYRYRGISQSRLKPALQGGVDVSLPAGFYLGTWLSTIKWIQDGGGNGKVEWDLYGGWKGEVTKGLTLDVGALRYQYPKNDLPITANTTELYGALSFGPFTGKYSHAVSNLFGFADSKKSEYLEVAGSFDVYNGVTLTPHFGHQTVRNNGAASYTDYSLTVSKDFSGLVPSIAYVYADTPAYVGPAPDSKNLARGALVLGIKYNF